MTALSRPKNLTPKRNIFWDYKKHRKTSAERWTFLLTATFYFDTYNPFVTLRVPPSLTQGRQLPPRSLSAYKALAKVVFPIFQLSIFNCQFELPPRSLSAHKVSIETRLPNFQFSIVNFQFLKILRNRVMDILAHFHDHAVIVAVKTALAV